MPDFSREAVHKFWHEYQDKSVYRVVVFMEGVERWAFDGQTTVENVLQALGKELDDISSIDLSQLGQQQLFIRIACHLKMSRVLRLLQSIDTAHPGSASKLLIHAEEVSASPDDAAGLFLRRNIVFERLRLMSRVFSVARFGLVMKALEGEEHA